MPCVSASLASYIALGDTGCSLGDKQFFGFSPPVFGTDFDLNQIMVIPADTPNRPTIAFQFNTLSYFNQEHEMIEGYSVRVLPGGKPIGQVSTAITDSYMTGPGLISIREILCLGNAFSIVFGTCESTSSSAQLRAQQRLTSASAGWAQFEPQSLLGVWNDIVVRFSIPNEPFPYSIYFGSTVTEFDEIPEPGTALLIGAGVIAIWRFRR